MGGSPYGVWVWSIVTCVLPCLNLAKPLFPFHGTNCTLERLLGEVLGHSHHIFAFVMTFATLVLCLGVYVLLWMWVIPLEKYENIAINVLWMHACTINQFTHAFQTSPIHVNIQDSAQFKSSNDTWDSPPLKEHVQNTQSLIAMVMLSFTFCD